MGLVCSIIEWKDEALEVIRPNATPPLNFRLLTPASSPGSSVSSWSLGELMRGCSARSYAASCSSSRRLKLASLFAQRLLNGKRSLERFSSLKSRAHNYIRFDLVVTHLVQS